MPIIIDSTTRQRVSYMKHCGDIVYNKEGADTAITTEDVFITQARKSVGLTREQQMFGGIGNELMGTDAGILGAEIDNLTERGNRADTTVKQQVQVYIDLGTKNKS